MNTTTGRPQKYSGSRRLTNPTPAAPTFCKCTCFSNYTIIPLGPQHDADNPQQPPSGGEDPTRDPHSGTSRDSFESTRSPSNSDDDGDELDLSFAFAKRSAGRSGGGRVAMPHAARTASGNPEQRIRCPLNAEERKRSAEMPSLDDSYSSMFQRALMIEKRSSSTSCTQCNRAFCLGYNLPICKDAEEKDVQTMCFQRDSRKDQIIVWGFILGTGGLLGWAGIRRLLEMRENRRGLERQRAELDRGSYRPIGSDGQN
ncbi:hypothetical protein MKZ38_003572 [Zalerion maritima]|uniref:Uncharacterized protein n=1 Tax=Zalerion maritima TaxID=339359 RepID=A0AAD5RMS5_9PEZI|nr:hypothetical protein MKZ38_003572 [Zalerion maritima]